jgi:hypothetical protein
MRNIPLKILTKGIEKVYFLLKKHEKGEYSEKLFNRLEENIE